MAPAGKSTSLTSRINGKTTHTYTHTIYDDYDDDSLKKLEVKLLRHVVMINTMLLPQIGIKVREGDTQLIKRY